MVALAASAAIAVYLLIPYALFRVVLSRWVPVRAFQENKAEEFTNASITLIAIFICSVLIVHHIPYLKNHPFLCSNDEQLRSADYKQVVAAIWSDKEFHNNDAFWSAMWRTAERQGRFLTWYYTSVAICGISSVILMHYYGRFWQKHKIAAGLVKLTVLHHVSQWYALLTPLLSPDKDTLVIADVLMTDQVLYRGEVVDYFLDKGGNLSGLILGKPLRFDRVAHLREREAWGTVRSTKAFWREIPSANLYLFASEIVNLNLTYESPKVWADDLRRELAKQVPQKKFTVTFEFKTRPPILGQKP
jgi:hypothetical protein